MVGAGVRRQEAGRGVCTGGGGGGLGVGWGGGVGAVWGEGKGVMCGGRCMQAGGRVSGQADR